MSSGDWEVHIGSGMQAIDVDQWNALARGCSPFLRHEFLCALEQSGSVATSTGWTPCHLQVRSSGRLIAAMPLYLKRHSYGEYVFDWSWADAYQRYGQRYYPKLLTAIPFTPSRSPRILVDNSAPLPELAGFITAAVRRYADSVNASSWHILFPETSQAAALAQQGLILREACQFHWHNRGYRDFGDFLQTLSSRKRKNLRKERADVASQGIVFEKIQGTEITAEHWKVFYRFYQNTYMVRGQQGYLTPDFFDQVAASMPENIMLLLARYKSEYVAGALFFHDHQALYGRYWGCDADYHNLHFETCYYQGIDYCIENQLQLFDAGAQGEHKLRRGFEPTTTVSCHWIKDLAFANAIKEFCREEAEHVSLYQDAAAERLPFRRGE
jgi:uncharacterized protein